MKRLNKDSSRMLNTSPVLRLPELTDCSARTTVREGDGRKAGKTRAGFQRAKGVGGEGQVHSQG